MRWIGSVCLMVMLPVVHAGDHGAVTRLLVQESFVSGFRHHDGRRVFPRLKVGDALGLVREPHNAEDRDAIRVEWKSYTLGYLPKHATRTLARQLDFGNRLAARITRLSKHRDPDRRVALEIYLPY